MPAPSFPVNMRADPHHGGGRPFQLQANDALPRYASFPMVLLLCARHLRAMPTYHRPWFRQPHRSRLRASYRYHFGRSVWLPALHHFWCIWRIRASALLQEWRFPRLAGTRTRHRKCLAPNAIMVITQARKQQACTTAKHAGPHLLHRTHAARIAPLLHAQYLPSKNRRLACTSRPLHTLSNFGCNYRMPLRRIARSPAAPSIIRTTEEGSGVGVVGSVLPPL